MTTNEDPNNEDTARRVHVLNVAIALATFGVLFWTAVYVLGRACWPLVRAAVCFGAL